MEIRKATFLKSLSRYQENITEIAYPEIVVLGRSNVGKSTFINRLLGRKSLARTGKQAGKTKLLNFFLVNDAFVLVDVPGYGYAHTSKQQIQEFGRMLESYFDGSKRLRLAILLLDIRRTPNEDDFLMAQYLQYLHLPMLIVLTKSDKLNRREQNLQTQYITSLFPESIVIAYSSLQPYSQILVIRNHIGEYLHDR